MTTAFHRIIHNAAHEKEADFVLLDVGPNLGAINRAAPIAADHVVMPLSPGLFSLQGLKNLGPTLHDWRQSWKQRLDQKPADLDIPMPAGRMQSSSSPFCHLDGTRLGTTDKRHVLQLPR